MPGRGGCDRAERTTRTPTLRLGIAVLACLVLSGAEMGVGNAAGVDPLAAGNDRWWRRIGLDVAQAPAPSLAIALVDTGIDFGHEDLAAVPVREAYVARNCGPDPACDAGERCSTAAQTVPPARFHGTAVAGLIAATRGNGAGIAGIAPVARLIAIDVFGADEAAGSRIAAGIECAIDKGARVINVSVQGKADTRAELEAALGRAEREGVLVIIAAGNEIGDLDRNPEWPAALHTSTSLTVTAVDLEDRLTGQRFGLESVDLAAPATERMVCTTFPGRGASETARDPDCSSTESGRYGRFGQSSAATAMVSGAALLLWSHPSYRDCTAQQVRALLLKHARTPESETTRGALSPFGGVLDVHFLAEVVRRDGGVLDLCSGAVR